MPGRTAAYRLKIPLTDATVPVNLTSIELRISVAGRQWVEHFPCATTTACDPDKFYDFVWDGTDAYGRQVQGEQPATVVLGYTYPAVLLDPGEYATRAFARFGTTQMSGVPSRREYTLWKRWNTGLGSYDPRGLGLGGWMLDQHHVFSPLRQRVYLGDGSEISTEDAVWVIDEMGPMVPANSKGLTALGDGSLVYAEGSSTLNRRDQDGNVTTLGAIAGPEDVVADTQGGIYVAQTQGNAGVIRYFPPGGGTPLTVAGSPGSVPNPICPEHDGTQRASQALLHPLHDLEVGPDGDLYFMQCGSVLRIDADGYIHHVAGGGNAVFTDQSGLEQVFNAMAVDLDSTGEEDGAIAIDDDGTLYVYVRKFGPAQVVRIGPDGWARRHAGFQWATSPSGDGGPARDATLSGVAQMVAREGVLYLLTNIGGATGIRAVDQDGIIRAVAGYDDPSPFCGGGAFCGAVGGAALRTQMDIRAMTALPDGDLVVGVAYENRLFRIGRPLSSGSALVIPSEDGKTAYRFDPSGRHLDTVDAVTGAVLYDFDYVVAGNPHEGALDAVTDVHGNVFDIQHDANGDVTQILAPFNRAFPITLTTAPGPSHGYLKTLADPTTNTFTVGYSQQASEAGLLTSFMKPANTNASGYGYDAWGRVDTVTDPLGKVKTFTRTVDTPDLVEVELETPEQLTKVYRYFPNQEPGGTRGDFQNSFPGASNDATSVVSPDGVMVVTQPSGTVVERTHTPDPRFGMMAPVVVEKTTTPGNKEMVVTRSRTVTHGTDPLDVTAWEEQVDVNGRVYKTKYEVAGVAPNEEHRWIIETPMGRTRRRIIDSASNRLLESALVDAYSAPITNIETPTTYGYDTGTGRLTSVTTGARVTTNGYHPTEGWLQTVTEQLTDTASQQTTYLRDAN
ncbi:MAG: hypothetical protein RIF41_26245, partial [Polyangiaceae bacterium]